MSDQLSIKKIMIEDTELSIIIMGSSAGWMFIFCEKRYGAFVDITNVENLDNIIETLTAQAKTTLKELKELSGKEVVKI